MQDQARIRHGCWLATAWLTLGFLATSSAVEAGESIEGAAVDFTRDVQPVLADRCYLCHGPDAEKREAKLRLDTREGALADRGGYAAVVPGALEESELWQRVTSSIEGERMPPTEPLDSQELSLLRRWIEAGAEWPRHWAFVQPAKPTPPLIEDDPGLRNPIDAFVRARLEAEGLEAAAEADARILARRLSLDLLGLPPTPDQIAALVSGSLAYEEYVDELFDSPHHAERLALHWLDQARYADTNGYSIDGGRHMWRWRDWVIDAYARNMPFDQFTIEQLAGDLLPEATLEQKIASGFNRNHMVTHEGGTIPEEYRVAYVVDRVKTTGETWLGLTVGCAQCHDHKYDPLTQSEFYQLFAFFNSVPEKGNDGDRGRNPEPTLKVPNESQAAQLQEFADQRHEIEQRMRAQAEAQPALRAAWEGRSLAQIEQPARAELSEWRALGPFQAENGYEAFAKPFQPEQWQRMGREVPEDVWRGGQEWPDGQVHQLGEEVGAWYLERTLVLEESQPVQISLGSDDGLKVWLEDELLLKRDVQRPAEADQERLDMVLPAGESRLRLKIANHGGPAAFYFRLVRVGLSPQELELVARPTAERDVEAEASLTRLFLDTDPAFADTRRERAAVDRQVEKLWRSIKTSVMVMQELPEPRPTYLLERGRYDQPGVELQPSTPAFLPSLPESGGQRANRLDLARWIVSSQNPLTSRVAVNRLWQMIFGTGLVATSGDFGVRGELPSHPKLLDWLACEFVESGWDVRHLLRLMVTSATYRQDSRFRVDVDRGPIDPSNRLLARAPRLRLQAEFVRDNALAIAGLLVSKLGGPGVKPYQPPGLWLEMSHFGSTHATEQIYVQGSGEDLWRRSLYTFWKRTVPPPAMSVFDAPSREVCVMARSRTNTPLQALVLLDDPTFVEAARSFAQRVLTSEEATDARLDLAFELALARPAEERESAILAPFLQSELDRFRTQPEQAEQLLTVGMAARDHALDPAEHAAWTAVCSLILNLSETITKR